MSIRSRVAGLEKQGVLLPVLVKDDDVLGVARQWRIKAVDGEDVWLAGS